MGAPWAGVPLPGGKPVPSGKMLMSQAAISTGSIGFPRFGAWAKAALEPRESARTKAVIGILRINMFDLPLVVDCPARGAVIVLARKSRYGRDFRRLSAECYDWSAVRRHVAGLVPRASLQDRRAAIPVPWHAEPGESLAVHRFLERRLRPALTTIGRHHDLRNPAVARIGDTGNLVEAGLFQKHPRRGMRDERFDLLQEIELVRLSAGQNRRVGAGFVIT